MTCRLLPPLRRRPAVIAFTLVKDEDALKHQLEVVTAKELQERGESASMAADAEEAGSGAGGAGGRPGAEEAGGDSASSSLAGNATDLSRPDGVAGEDAAEAPGAQAKSREDVVAGTPRGEGNAGAVIAVAAAAGAWELQQGRRAEEEEATTTTTAGSPRARYPFGL